MVDVKAISVPKGVEIEVTKSAIKFVKGAKKAYLKGSNLEITSPLKELGKRVRRYSAEVIEKCHLGSVQACIPGVAETVDLQKILNKYFRSK